MNIAHMKFSDISLSKLFLFHRTLLGQEIFLYLLFSCFLLPCDKLLFLFFEDSLLIDYYSLSFKFLFFLW